jgi:iron complex outermembrane receptor protein
MRNFTLVLALIFLLCLPVAKAQQINDTILLDPVNVIENVNRKIPYQKNIITKSEIQQISTRDVGEMLRFIPNVSGLRKGGANIDPVVRGFKYSQLMTLINGAVGLEGGCPNRMDPTTSHIDIDDIERIEVIKGPFALRYGPSFGGVINLITFQPVLKKSFEIHTNASVGYESNYNGNKEHLNIYGGTSKINFVTTANRIKYGDYSDGNDLIVKSAFSKYSYSARLNYNPADKHHISLFWISSHHRNVRFPALQMDEREDNTDIMGLSYITSGHKGVFSGANLKASYSMVDHMMDNKYRPNSDTMIAVSTVDANTLGVRGGVDLNFKNKYFLFIGGDYQNIYKDGNRDKTMIMQPPVNGAIPEKVEALWNKASIQNIGIYSEFKTSPGSWDLVAALRLDLNSANSGKIEVLGTTSGGITPVLLSIEDTKSNFTNFSFNIGAEKHFGKHYSLGISAGRGVRSPNMVERFIILLPVGYDNYDYFGNPSLKPEANNEADITFRYTHEKAGSAEVNVFYSIVQDFILGRRIPPSEQKPLSANVLGVKQFYNAGNATFTGFELAWALPKEYKLGVKVSAAYTYAIISKVTKQILNPALVISQQVVGEEEVKNDALPEIPALETDIGISYKFLNERLIPGVNVNLTFDQSHVSSAFYEPSTPGYALVNLSLLYKFKKFISLSGGVNNLFNTAYYNHLNRKMIGTTTKLYEPGRVFYLNAFLNL